MYISFGIPFCDTLLPQEEKRQMMLARAAGFSYTELVLGEDCFDTRLAAAKASDVFVSHARLPRDGISLIWQSDEAWAPLHTVYLACLAAAKESGISTVIVALDDGERALPPTQSGLSHLRTLAREAEEMDICLAFENGASPECFELAVRSCCRGFHGVSFRPAAFFKTAGTSAVPQYAYKNLIAVALDDVFEGEDRYIPGDGVIDYRPLACSLAEAEYGGLFFATVSPKRGKYRKMCYESFASCTYEALYRIVRMCRDEGGCL